MLPVFLVRVDKFLSYFETVTNYSNKREVINHVLPFASNLVPLNLDKIRGMVSLGYALFPGELVAALPNSRLA